MQKIKSVEDLNRLRQEALQKRRLEGESDRIRITIGIGTPSLASGAQASLNAIIEYIEKEKLNNVAVHQAGSFGLDLGEPVVQIAAAGGPVYTYGSVTPNVARRILAEHVVGGKILPDHLIKIEKVL